MVTLGWIVREKRGACPVGGALCRGLDGCHEEGDAWEWLSYPFAGCVAVAGKLRVYALIAGLTAVQLAAVSGLVSHLRLHISSQPQPQPQPRN
jgi:hypothetical protein